MSQVITILEAEVAPERASVLEAAFREAIAQLDQGIERTFLVQEANTNTWRVITIWESREALTAMRQSGGTPRGVIMFRAAGAEPKLAMFDVKCSASL